MPRQEFAQMFRAGTVHVQIYESPEALGRAAAERAAQILAEAIAKKGQARLIGATGNSQIPLANALVKQPIDWNSVDLFHMDEYAGMPANHPASFRLWIKQRYADKVRPRNTYYLEGDAADLEAEMKRYSQLLLDASIDLAFVGIGENGHIAFNDPPVADFNDPLTVKRVTLDEGCRRQQAGEGHFKDIGSVPSDALTITCPGLFRAEAWVCCVPDLRKAEAVRNALEGPISEACPASLIRKHPKAYLYLDEESASLLSSGTKHA
jgi:glucosamine-6-phosphate deaminase